MAREHRHVARMHPADQELDCAKHRPGTDRESVLEHPLYRSSTRTPMGVGNVDRFQDVAQIDHTGFPTALLMVNHRFQCGRRGPMAAAGVKEDQVDLRSRLSAGAKTRAAFMIRTASSADSHPARRPRARPIQQPSTPFVFRDRGTTLHPVAVIDVPDRSDAPLFRAMDVAADYSVDLVAAGGLGHGAIAEIGQILDRLFDPAFEIRGKRTLRSRRGFPRRYTSGRFASREVGLVTHLRNQRLGLSEPSN